MKHEPEIQQTDFMLLIPTGHFVHKVDLDCDEPYCLTSHKDTCTVDGPKILIPKALAYYLRTHFCGSNQMRETIRLHQRQETAQLLRSILDGGNPNEP
jgi:hypothetical protein